MPNAILVVMVLAVSDVLGIAHCHLLATVPVDEERLVHLHMANAKNAVIVNSSLCSIQLMSKIYW